MTYNVPGSLPAPVTVDPGKVQQGGGGAFFYPNEIGQALPVRYQQKQLYIEKTWLVTNTPSIGELLYGQNFVQYNQISLQPQQGYFEAIALTGQTLQWSAVQIRPLPVMQRVAWAGLVPSINWGSGPYCTRGWISSLMPTVTCKGTISLRGQNVVIAQNLHVNKNWGSAWLEGVDNAFVSPDGLPAEWKAAAGSSMPDGTTRDDFKAEIIFSDYLKSLGGQEINQASEAIRLNRWRVLFLKFGEDIKKAPGGPAIYDILNSNRPDPSLTYNLNSA